MMQVKMETLIQFDSRKVVKHGYSLYISVPKLWAKNKGVKRGDKLRAIWDKETGNLIIKPKEEDHDRTT